MFPTSTALSAGIRRSKLQIEVIRFYRECCKAIKRKPPETQIRFQQFLRFQFRQHRISPKDHAAIEYLLRRGKKQLETYQSDSIKDVTV
ncbi:4198_t:CDS:2 [Dentiscutata heterogama]|uniref:4198_t:CDS:1 n=1 Tax=Dentiscutata heterogama TaxID=1316150 RepID=A0ACA9KL64_9GLOM|nr:4198_t:CDS:2 [Dentiscutata heterogama]